MTKSEAISQLQERIDLINKDYFDLQLDKYAEALEMAIEALNQFAGVDKKVSAERQEGDLITSAQPDVPEIYVGDMIYRQAAVDAIDALHDKPNAWLDSAVDAVMALPSAQPEKRTIKRTGTHACDLISRKKVRYKLTALVNELEEIFANIREKNEDDSVCGLCEYDGAYIGQSGDWCNECPGFDKSDCFKLKDKYRHEWETIDE